MRKNIILCLMLMAASLMAPHLQAEKGDIMGFAGLSRTSSEVELYGEQETVTGYELGVEYEWIRDDKLGSATRLSLKNVNADTTGLLFSAEIAMNMITIGQVLTYDLELGGHKISPFGSIDIGAGLAKAEVNVLGTTSESDNEFVPYASAAVGVRLTLDKWVPFIMGGYQYAESDDLVISNSSVLNSDVDFSGGFFTVGLGMIF